MTLQTDQRTVAQRVTLGQERLGKTTTTGVDFYHSINEGGRRLMAAQGWSWRKTHLSLTGIAQQEYIELPRDFRRMVTIEPLRGTVNAVRLVPLTTIIARRRHNTGVLSDVYQWVALNTRASADARLGPLQVLELEPPPSTTGPMFDLHYERQWVTVSSADTDAVPCTPPEASEALKHAYLAALMVDVDADPSDDEARFRLLVDELRREDGMRQPNLGRLTGGADRHLDWEDTGRRRRVLPLIDL
jgi:hypothetical protein